MPGYRGPTKAKNKSGAPSRCRICNAVLNSHNDTGICMHGHKSNPQILEIQRQKDAAEKRYRPLMPSKETPPLPGPRTLPYGYNAKTKPLTPEKIAYAENLLCQVCAEYGITSDAIRDKGMHNKNITEARLVFMYIAHNEPVLIDIEIGQFMQRHASDVSRANARIQMTRRRDTALDKRVAVIVHLRTLVKE